MSSIHPFHTKGEYPTWKELNTISLPRCQNWLELHAASKMKDALIFDEWNIRWNTGMPRGGGREGLLVLPDKRIFRIDAQEISRLDDGTYTAALPLYFDLNSGQKKATYITNFVIGHFHDADFIQVAVVEVIGGLLIDTDESADWLLGEPVRGRQVLNSGMYAGFNYFTEEEGAQADRLIQPHYEKKSLRFRHTSLEPPPSVSQVLWSFLLTLVLSFAV
jgi:hypothetical protein